MTRGRILQVVPLDSMYEIHGSVTYYKKRQETFIMRRNGSLTVEYQEKYLQVL